MAATKVEVRAGGPISPLTALRDQQSLQERTYQALRKAILDGHYEPGQRMYETELANLLAVSRNPVREAIRRLQQDGLLEVRPRSGIYVATVPANEVEDVYRIRVALEGTAAALAAERMTDEELSELGVILQRESQRRRTGSDSSTASGNVARADRFHQAIHHGAHSPRLSQSLELIYGQVMQFRGLTLRLPGRVNAAIRGHTEIYRALKRRDAEAAERLMRAHVDGARQILMRHLTRTKTTATE
jgi:DNA-binding GntR family transcriptional regulator